MRLADDLIYVASREGGIVSSSKGCFRLGTSSAERFVGEVLRDLCQVDPRGATKPEAIGGDWFPLFGAQLEQAGILLSSPLGSVERTVPNPTPAVSVVRATPLMELVSERLGEQGIPTIDTGSIGSLAVLDLSGLDADESLSFVREVHQRGQRSISLWRDGPDTLYGPLAMPGDTACWNCCHLRFRDSTPLDSAPFDEKTTARILADNISLILRFPALSPYGCVLVESTDSSSLHTIVPVPWCEVCGVDAEPSRVPTMTRSELIPEELRILSDPRGGLIRHVWIFESDGIDSPALPVCASALVAPKPGDTAGRPASQGEGKGATREEAVRGAIGEAIERYAASLWHPTSLTYASFSELGVRAFDPRWLVLYDDEQYARSDFPFAPFVAEQPIAWTQGLWLDTGEPVLAPALATYMNFPAAADEQFGQTTSNGLAAGVSFEDAALRALYELIERDAFMLSWLSERPGIRLIVDDDDGLTGRALREVQRLGASTELYLLDVGTGYPTVACLGLGDGVRWPGVTIGLGTHARLDVALRKAVFEHGHCGAFIRRLMREGEHERVRDPQDVKTGLDHALYYVESPARGSGGAVSRGSPGSTDPCAGTVGLSTGSHPRGLCGSTRRRGHSRCGGRCNSPGRRSGTCSRGPRLRRQYAACSFRIRLPAPAKSETGSPSRGRSGGHPAPARLTLAGSVGLGSTWRAEGFERRRRDAGRSRACRRGPGCRRRRRRRAGRRRRGLSGAPGARRRGGR